MTEKWTKWEPLQGLASRYRIDGFANKIERIVHKNPLPYQDSPDTPEPLRRLFSNSVLEEELSNEFFILLSESNNRYNQILITFGDSSICYRSTPVKYRRELMDNLEKEYGSSFLDWTFFKVENSSYLTWLKDQSYEIISSNSFHFSFVANNVTLDVITGCEPTIKFMNE